MKDKYTVEGGVNLFPEHFDDPQKSLFLEGVRVAVRSLAVLL